MTSYNFTISSSFTSGLDIGQLGEEITSSNISPTFQGMTTTGDNVEIFFASSLSGGEQNTLNTLISTHTPVTASVQKISNITPQITTITTASYKENGIFNYSGKKVLPIVKITVTSYIATTGNYTIKIYDMTNNKIICETTFTNTTEAECDMGTISNLPVQKAKWQILTKSARSGTIKNLSLYY